jgi:hypothetical protein
MYPGIEAKLNIKRSQEWRSEMFSLMPIYDNISRDGVTV